MKRRGNLFPAVTDYGNLYCAFRKAFKGSALNEDSLTFFFHLEKELIRLKSDLEMDRYTPGHYRHFKVYDPKERTISVAPFRDRVVHHAIVNVLDPIYEKTFIHDSYATREGKGTHKAIDRAQQFLRRRRWFLKADIDKYFESVDHDILLNLLGRKIKDGRMLGLLATVIKNGGQGGRGLPIGNLTSQFLANVYLDPLDHFVRERPDGLPYLRYMDDFVLFSDDRGHLRRLREEVRRFLDQRLNLRLKESILMINQRLHGLTFVGARIFPNLVRIRRESLRRSLKRLRLRQEQIKRGEISGKSFRDSTISVIGHISSFDSYLLRKGIFG